MGGYLTFCFALAALLSVGLLSLPVSAQKNRVVYLPLVMNGNPVPTSFPTVTPIPSPTSLAGAPTVTAVPSPTVLVSPTMRPIPSSTRTSVPPSPTRTTRPSPTQTVAPQCDPSYPTVCIPSPPPMLSCDEVEFRDFVVLPPDPHGFDRNQNGIGCEREPDP